MPEYVSKGSKLQRETFSAWLENLEHLYNIFLQIWSIQTSAILNFGILVYSDQVLVISNSRYMFLSSFWKKWAITWLYSTKFVDLYCLSDMRSGSQPPSWILRKAQGSKIFYCQKMFLQGLNSRKKSFPACPEKVGPISYSALWLWVHGSM